MPCCGNVKVLSCGQMPKRLPSVSVCIEARGDSGQLANALSKVLASHYPKLEVIVLDNGFMDMEPPLVRLFATRGVRFIEGSRLESDLAIETMKIHASGAYIFYIDIDTRLEPDTISQLVRNSAFESSAPNETWFSHRELIEES